MKREHVFFVIIIMVALIQSAGVRAQTLDQLVTEARKEGAIEFYAPSTLTPQGAQALGDAFNKKYQLKIKVNYSPAGQMARDVAKVLTFAAAGAARRSGT